MQNIRTISFYACFIVEINFATLIIIIKLLTGCGNIGNPVRYSVIVRRQFCKSQKGGCFEAFFLISDLFCLMHFEFLAHEICLLYR